MEELERLPADTTHFFINFFNAPPNASFEQMWITFEDFKVDDIIPNKLLPNVFDVKVESRDTFREIISREFMIAGKPVFFRFSWIIR